MNINSTSVDKPLIEFKNITKIYGMEQAAMMALRGVDFSIMKSEFIAVMGPSGSGKSTCLNILGCLDQPTSGSYTFMDIAVGGLSRDQRALLRRHYFGFVFQGFNLLHRTSAIENVELPLIYRGLSASDRKELSYNALKIVGLEEWANHKPSELSGGQQQRVAIARAIVTSPYVLMADEPTGNLDTARSIEIMELLCRLNTDQGITIIMVTHETTMAEFAKRSIHFRDGLIEKDDKTGEPV
jgi:putative ABC transport system ATP-binding protein